MSAVTQRYRLDVAPDRGEGTAQNNAGPAPRGVGDDARRIDRRRRKPVNHSPFKKLFVLVAMQLKILYSSLTSVNKGR